MRNFLLSTYCNTRNKKVFVIFTETTKLIKYFDDHHYSLDVLALPMQGEESLSPIIETKIKITFNNIFIKFLYIFKYDRNKTSILLKVRDFITTFYVVSKGEYNFFLGVESINTAAALLARKFFLKNYRVIYFCNDYSPNRYSPIIQMIYDYLDKFCAYGSDYNLLMNMDIQKERVKVGIDSQRVKRLYDISGGIAMPNLMKKNLYKVGGVVKVIYASRDHTYGLKIAIDLLKCMLSEGINIFMTITGGTTIENIDPQDYEIVKNNLSLTGFLGIDELDRVINQSHVGLAIYPTATQSSADFGDPEKIRRYLNAGLPIVCSGGGRTVGLVNQYDCGLHVDYSVLAFKNALIQITGNQEVYDTYSLNATRLGNNLRESDKFSQFLNSL